MPAWLAVIEHVPVLTMVSVALDSVQTAGVVEFNVTGSVEDAVAERENGAVANGTPVSGPKEIVCAPLTTEKL